MQLPGAQLPGPPIDPPTVVIFTCPFGLSEAAVPEVELTITLPSVMVTSPFWPSSVRPVGFRTHSAHGPPAASVVVCDAATVKTTFAVDEAPTVRSPFPIALAK